MPICGKCGNEVAEGKKFCGKCGAKIDESSHGSPLPSPGGGSFNYDFSIDPALEPPPAIIDESAFADIPEDGSNTQAQAPVPNIPAPAPAKQPSIPQYTPDDSGIVLDDIPLIDPPAPKKPSIPLKKRPEVWFAASAMLLIPAFLLPWFSFFENEPLSAFRLPLIFIFSDRVQLLPWLTVGLVVTASFIGLIAFSFIKNKYAVAFKTISYILILLTVGIFLLTVRHWNAFLGLNVNYAKYLDTRLQWLPDDPIPQLQLIKHTEPVVVSKPVAGIPNKAQNPVKPVAPQPRAGVSIPPQTAAAPMKIPAGTVVETATAQLATIAKPGLPAPGKIIPAKPIKRRPTFLSFMFSVFGFGTVFALISGIFLIFACGRMATKLEYPDLQIPSTVGAILIAVLIIIIAPILIARFFPMRWYYTENRLLSIAGMNRAAVSRLHKCVGLPIEDYICKSVLAGDYRKAGMVRESLQLYSSVTREKPEFADAHKGVADLYFAGKNYWKAAEEYRKYILLRPYSPEVREKLSTSLLYIADQYAAYGRLSGAAKFYEEAMSVLEKNKSNSNLQYKLGKLYLRLGKISFGIDHLKAAADLLPRDYELQMLVAELFRSKRNYDIARQYYERAISIQPGKSEPYIKIANMYLKDLKDQNQAAQWYQKAIDANPVSDASKEAKRLLESLK
ncbi:MAG TPA: tetratricopeptide repeat protein [bacterium]|nr:tetratricopeptide repeat protein [bacterium]